MYIFGFKRPPSALEDYHPKGTTVTLDLDYHEMILLDHALHSYAETHDMTEKEKYFKWQFCFLRDILKNGNIDGFNCALYEEAFPHKNDEIINILNDEVNNKEVLKNENKS